MFFKARATVDADEQAWLLAAWRWLDDVIGAVEINDTLFLPITAHFPPNRLTGHAAAEHDFALVKGHCAMATWPTRLVAQRERPALKATWAHDYVAANDPGGSYYSPDGEIAVITYDPALLEMRAHLIYTFAHELSHYALSRATTPPPGGEPYMELCTDLAAAHLGFGLFGCTTVIKSYKGEMAYMPEHVWYFAAALFCELTNAQPNIYEAHATSWVRSGIRKNRAYLGANSHLIADLRAAAAQ
jgi:hypothetical protein